MAGKAAAKAVAGGGAAARGAAGAAGAAGARRGAKETFTEVASNQIWRESIQRETKEQR